MAEALQTVWVRVVGTDMSAKGTQESPGAMARAEGRSGRTSL